jgi:hydrogenase nickel incorporation protein HypA/HybF
MHELSLAAGILDLVEDAGRREGFARVAVLRLEVGRLAGVEVSALRFALQAIAPGTCLAGARVEIDEPAARAACPDCGADVEVTGHGQACPACGGAPLRPTGGTALRVVDLLVEDERRSEACA